MRILIGIDGSPKALDAVRLVGRLACPTADAVAFFFSPAELERQLPGRSATIVEAAVAALRDEARGLLPEACGRQAEFLTVAKPPAIGLLETASSWRADMIVVGARGHGSIESFLLGSVSRAVVHGAGLPVLVARRPVPEGRGLKALVCHHPASAAAVAAKVGRLHWASGTEGRVIGVAESLLAGRLPDWVEQRVRDPDTAAIAKAWEQEHDAEVAALEGTLRRFQATLPEPFRGHPPIVAQGNPGERILEQAQADGTDLVVVGRTPTDALSRWLLGSTSEAVLTHAQASVLIVPVEKKA